MKNTICNYKECTGCGLCVYSCPRQCISFTEGKFGHLFPQVENDKCIDCGICKKKCPVNNPPKLLYPKRVYAAFSKDFHEYKTSTSGAIASVLSKFTISLNGVVYGSVVCYSKYGFEVKHVRVIEEKDLCKLKGSKYVKSDITEVLPLIKQDVDNLKFVLFIGTPCQVSAVRGLFKNKDIPDNLLLIDLICHGVPSLSFLKRHVRSKVGNEIINDLRFRDGRQYKLSFRNKEKTVYECRLWEERYKDLFLNMFIDGYSCRESCHSCKYAQNSRVSDMTIGDYWGLGNQYPANEIIEHNEGISCVLINTSKGEQMLKKVNDLIYNYERPLEEIFAGNERLSSPMNKPIRFFMFKILNNIFGEELSYHLCEIDNILLKNIERSKLFDSFQIVEKKIRYRYINKFRKIS